MKTIAGSRGVFVPSPDFALANSLSRRATAKVEARVKKMIQNELRVCAARSRRRSPVGRTRGGEARSNAMEISTGALDGGIGDHRPGGPAAGADRDIPSPRRCYFPGRRHHLGQILAHGL